MAFDKHLNLVLSDTEEYRNLTSAKSNLTNVVEERQEKRLLGLIILRGENVVSIAVEGPPPNDGAKRAKLMPGGPGVSKGVGRGMSSSSSSQQRPMMGGGGAPMGLGPGAVPGVGSGSGQFAMSMGRGMPPPPPR
eukprot:CAMPEP_0196805154 /NCGR_PEP_ID=MMETSP1362-20130617/4898_1 /TAXON_ID=163516 /ORGANISM="Leptocylindrus danicus, Strain CCMP1856" /LENGTH=134 /DNA_ID=CAMNT_0042177893 /DNA_START=177 /DNA_END=581 /DNA_ORIENTATION=+